MVNKQRIREMLQFQDLSEEEKARRGILGRLYGPCASITDATRNGRKYDDTLWENVFSKNEIVREMFENGGIPMELDHPVDREETDSQRIAAMLPEPPKKDKDGHLICYVDIIDTPCGKIAYQLAKYGFKLGISSRGSGDVLPDDTVDPDTYDFTTFDLVLLPAVKDARLSMCESLDTKSSAFKQAIEESYSTASGRDKEIMKETLEDLNIDISLDDNGNVVCDPEDNSDKLLEAEDDREELEIVDEEELEAPVEEVAEEDAEVETEEEVSDEEIEEQPKEEAITVEEVIDELKDVDSDAVVEIAPIEVNGEEIEVNDIEIKAEDDKVVIELDCNPEMDSNIDNEEVALDAEEAKEEPEVVEFEAKAEEAVDDGIEEVADDETEKLEEAIKTLAETIRSKNDLESKIKSLQSEKTVSDAEVKKLTEELERYKNAFERTSVIAAKVKDSESQIKALNEQLDAKNVELEQVKAAQVTRLNEGLDSSKKQIKMLSDKVESLQEQLTEKDEQTNAQISKYRKALQEKVNIANDYKAKAEQVLTEYINYRANMLGVRPSEITNRLDENYSISDINNVCDEILTDGARRPVFGMNTQPRIKVTEQAQKHAPNTLESGYEVDDSLLELAGLI